MGLVINHSCLYCCKLQLSTSCDLYAFRPYNPLFILRLLINCLISYLACQIIKKLGKSLLLNYFFFYITKDFIILLLNRKQTYPLSLSFIDKSVVNFQILWCPDVWVLRHDLRLIFFISFRI